MARQRSSSRVRTRSTGEPPPALLLALVLAGAGSLQPAAQAQQQPTPTAQPNLPTTGERLPAGKGNRPSRSASFPQNNTAPETVEVRGDGRCSRARPGDTVYYTLTVEGVDAAQEVVGDLRLRQGRAPGRSHDDSLLPDFGSLGGGGVGTRDGASPDVFHFEFKIPEQIYGGKYQGVSVEVHAEASGPGLPPAADRGGNRLGPPNASHADAFDVTRRTRKAVKAYCLNVVSGFGADLRPAVTSFAPGPVAAPSAPGPVAAPSAPRPVQPE